VAGIAAFVAVFGIACTWWLGSAEGWATAPGTKPPAPPIAQSAAGEGADDEEAHAPNAAEIEAMVERLAERLQQQPDNVQGWLMLGRSRAVLGQLDQAAAAFRHVLSLQPGQDQAQEAQEGLAQVQAMAAQQTAAMATGAAAPPTDDAAATPAAPGAGLSGRVELAPALASQVAPGDTVFVFARAAQGSRMPLAIVKRQVSDLPFEFTLDDSSAMTPQARLSQATAVVVGARISKSGQATPRPGDFEALSSPMAPGASGLKLVIAEPVR
jgi:cytochrome c-type biogenesis protein CcmH